MSVAKYWITGGPIVCDDGMLWPHHALMKKRKSEGLVDLYPAKFNVRCVDCGRWIDEGEYSYWQRGAGNYCQRCVV